MAEEIGYKITVDGQGAEKSIGDIKKEFKELSKELDNTVKGTEEYRDALSKLASSKNSLTQLKNELKALEPGQGLKAVGQLTASVASGFAAAQGAMAIFGSQSEDLGKVLVRVQAAMALAQGLQGLSGFTKALYAARAAMIAFAASNPFTAIAAAVGILAVALWGLAQSMDENKRRGEELEEQNKLLEESYNRIGKAADLAQRRMKALGATDKELFDAQQLRREKELENLEARWLGVSERLNKELGDTEELKEQYSQLLFEIDQKKQEIEIAAIEFSNSVLEEQAKRLDEQFAILEKQAEKEKDLEKKKQEELKKIREEAWKEETRRILEAIRTANKVEADLDKQKQDEQDELDKMNMENDMLTRQVLEEDDRKHKDNLLRAEEQFQFLKREIARQSFIIIGQLATAFAGESEAAQKRAFQINKAAGIATTTIDTYIAAQGAYKSQMAIPTPDAPVRASIAAGLAIAQGLARVAIIAAQKFESPAAPSGGGTINTPNLNSPASQPQPFGTGQVAINQNEQGQFTGFGSGGRLKAYVVESELTSVQNNIKSIEERTTF